MHGLTCTRTESERTESVLGCRVNELKYVVTVRERAADISRETVHESEHTVCLPKSNLNRYGYTVNVHECTENVM